MKEFIMKHKILFNAAAVVVVLANLTLAGSSNSGQAQQPSNSNGAQQKSVPANWAETIQVYDPFFQMTAFTVDVPVGWKFAGDVARSNGCHGAPASLEYTAMSPDRQIAIERLPDVAWNVWSNNPNTRNIWRCPPVEIDSAKDFLVNVVVPSLHGTAKILEVLAPTAQGQQTIEEIHQVVERRNAYMAQLANNPPASLKTEGARVHIVYEENGRQYEEVIMAVITCFQSSPRLNPRLVNVYCNTEQGVTIVRAPMGNLSSMLADNEFMQVVLGVHDNPDWQFQLAENALRLYVTLLQQQNLMAAAAQAASDANFRQMMHNNDIFFQGLMAKSQAFNANLQHGTDLSIARARAATNYMQYTAHQTVLYALDQREYSIQGTGQIVNASNRYNQVWGSTDGSMVVGTYGRENPNDYTAPGAPILHPLVPR